MKNFPKVKGNIQLLLMLCTKLLLITGLVFYMNQQNERKRLAAMPVPPYTRLMQGNDRFAMGKSKHPDESVQHRQAVSKSQHPFAVVVTCSDSRLSPELIFDQGLGDLFVIRTAGNIIGAVEMGSIEYAVGHLGANLIIVMGHEHCGAIAAMMEGETPHGHIKTIVDSLKQELEMQGPLARRNVHEAEIANVKHQVTAIARDSFIREFKNNKPVNIRGLIYSLESGRLISVHSMNLH